MLLEDRKQKCNMLLSTTTVFVLHLKTPDSLRLRMACNMNDRNMAEAIMNDWKWRGVNCWETHLRVTIGRTINVMSNNPPKTEPTTTSASCHAKKKQTQMPYHQQYCTNKITKNIFCQTKLFKFFTTWRHRNNELNWLYARLIWKGKQLYQRK